jgi:dihydrolipoamide dehydrogenase
LAAAQTAGLRPRVGTAPISLLGKANTVDQFDGFVKVVTNRQGVIVGASIVAPNAGEMIHELMLAIKFRLTAAQIAATIHAFPTYSEAIKMACANVD